MAKCFLIHFWFWISLILVLSSSSAVSQEVRFNPNIPAPQVVYRTPKTPILQLAWTLPSYQQNDIQRYEVSVIRIFEGGYPEIDDPEGGDDGPTRVFTCDNDNFNEGLCTISGLSANSQYNVTVRACNANGCGLAAVAYITTARTSRLSIISTLLVIACLVIILISSVRSYDMIVELSKYCRKLASSRVIPEREPNVEIQESSSAPNLQAIELTQLSGNSNHSLELSDVDIDRALAVPPSTPTVISPNPQTENGNRKADGQNGLAASALAQEALPPPSQQQSPSSRNSFRKVSN